MIKKRKPALCVARGTCSQRLTEKEATTALAMLAIWFEQSGASSIELHDFATGRTVRASVTCGSVNSQSAFAPITIF